MFFSIWVMSIFLFVSVFSRWKESRKYCVAFITFIICSGHFLFICLYFHVEIKRKVPSIVWPSLYSLYYSGHFYVGYFPPHSYKVAIKKIFHFLLNQHAFHNLCLIFIRLGLFCDVLFFLNQICACYFKRPKIWLFFNQPFQRRCKIIPGPSKHISSC